MGQTTKPTFLREPNQDAIEDEVDAVIELCGGDARVAVRGLILGQALMKKEMRTGMFASHRRGRLH